MATHHPIFTGTPSVTYTIEEDHDLYLDTSVVRRSGSKLPASKCVARSYTSSFTLIELLHGITRSPKEFSQRRSAIGGILKSRIPIDWHMPDIRLRCAFTALREKYDIFEKRPECLRDLLTALGVSATAKMFARYERQLHLEYGLDYFENLDDEISRTHIEATRKWVPYNRAQFSDSSTAEFLKLFGMPSDASIRELNDRMAGSDFDFGLGIFALTKKFTMEEGEYSEVFHDELFRSYDGSIDLYVRAADFQLRREVGRFDTPGRNTAADLVHMSYVVPQACVATTDVGMRNAVIEAGGDAVGEEVLLT